MSKQWSQEHVQLAATVNRVCQKLLDVANTEMATQANPALTRTLIALAGELRRGFRPRRIERERAA